MPVYFCKVSWTDPKQPLIREHKNTKVWLDLSRDEWDIINNVHNEIFGRHADFNEGFTIDFMIEIPGT